MFLYIDPGTGSMLFTVLIGIIGAAIFSVRMLFVKLKYKLKGGKAEVSDQKIPLVIFSDHKRYWPVFEPICRELDKRGQEVLYITASPDDPAMECPFEHFKAESYESESKLFMRLNYLNAHIVLATSPGLDVYQWKRSKQVDYYVHIPHSPCEILRYRMFGIDYYDALILSGQYQIDNIRSLEKLRELPEKELLLVGIPYMDEMAKKLETLPPVQEHETTVLLAPTWGKSGILEVYGGKFIDKILETGYKLIIRPHPQSLVSDKSLLDRLMKEYPSSDRIEWNSDMDNLDVLRRSDIMISDFSGVIFDFAMLHDKPVIYTAPNFDLGLYDAWWLDEPLWTLKILPEIGRELTEDSMDSIKELIDSCLKDDKYSEGRKKAIRETWAYTGEGAVRVADYLTDKLCEITKKEEAEEVKENVAV